jgi:hypothetical protein
LYLLVSAGTLVATVAVTPQTRTLAITRVSVVDVIDGRIVPNSIVTIRGETISSVSQNGDLAADAQVVDVRANSSYRVSGTCTRTSRGTKRLGCRCTSPTA